MCTVFRRWTSFRGVCGCAEAHTPLALSRSRPRQPPASKKTLRCQLEFRARYFLSPATEA